MAESRSTPIFTGKVHKLIVMKVDIKTLTEPSQIVRPLQSNSLEFELLKDSVRQNGLLQPLSVSRGQIVDGYRRWLACRALGWKEIDVHEVEGDPDTLRVICQTRNTEFNRENRKAVLAELLARDQSLTSGEIAHLYQWSPVDVEHLVGVQYLIEEAKRGYEAGTVSLAEVWQLSRLLDHDQREVMEEGTEGLYERAEERHRIVRARRRKELTMKPRTKSYPKIEAEADHPVQAGPALIAANAQTALDGWIAALNWVLQRS